MVSGHLSLGFIQKVCRKGESTGRSVLTLVQTGSVVSDMAIGCIGKGITEVILAWLAG